MSISLKPIAEQVMVITGASSGIGLATALHAARLGARVVLASRNEPELEKIAERIRREGGEALAVVTDVSRREDMQRLADRTVEAFGGFDTWVNNAGIGIYGRLEEVSDEDHHRLFEINFWGLVYGTQIAAAHLKPKGGAIINLGSVVSDIALPIQGMYAASKHAIKGFTDAFRMELMAEKAPISVTLIKPSAINTPFPQHARNYLDEEPTLPPPVYQPEDVASAIVHAAQHGGRDYYIGSGGKLMSSLNKRIPSLMDWGASRSGKLESSGPVSRPREGSLYGPATDGSARGDLSLQARRSLYTGAQTHPMTTAAVFATAGVAVFALFAAGKRR